MYHKGKVMKMLKQIAERRSVRKYQNREVEREKLLEILESGRMTPSGTNAQPWIFMVIENEETKRAIAKVDHDQEWMLTAPTFIVGIADASSRLGDTTDLILDENSPQGPLKKAIRDTAVALGYMMLEAENQGLATCWTGWYDQKEMKKALGVPDDKYVVGVLTLGYADESPAARPRKSLDEIVKYEIW